MSASAYQGWCCTHFTLLVSILQPQCVHGTHDSSQRLDGVAVDHWLVLLHIITRETVLMDDPVDITETMLESLRFVCVCVCVGEHPPGQRNQTPVSRQGSCSISLKCSPQASVLLKIITAQETFRLTVSCPSYSDNTKAEEGWRWRKHT